MSTIFLLEGPVGAGKSTHAAKLSSQHQAARLVLDEWMVTLFRPDRPAENFMGWYNDVKARCIEQIWRCAVELLDLGQDVILELGLVQQADREAFYARVDITQYNLRVVVLETPEALRHQRVQRRNQEQGSTYQMEVSDEIFALANSAWQPLSDTECAEREVEFINNG